METLSLLFVPPAKGGGMEIKMKKKNYNIILIVIVFVYLLSANKLILIITGKQYDVTEVTELPEINNERIYYDFDNKYALDTLTEDYFIQGWAFCESGSLGEPDSLRVSYENLDKKITLYLVSDKHMYKIETDPISRLDIWQVFEESKNIHGMYHGYNAQFSTLAIKDGIYDLYILSEENEVDKSFNACAVSFEKLGTKFNRRMNTPVKNITNMKSIEMEFYLDGAGLDSDILSLYGWGLSQMLDMQIATTYIQATTSEGECNIFRVYNQYRDDIVGAYNNQSYKMVGYHCPIPLEFLGQGKSELRLVIQQGNDYYISSKEIVVDVNDYDN